MCCGTAIWQQSKVNPPRWRRVGATASDPQLTYLNTRVLQLYTYEEPSPETRRPPACRQCADGHRWRWLQPFSFDGPDHSTTAFCSISSTIAITCATVSCQGRCRGSAAIM